MQSPPTHTHVGVNLFKCSPEWKKKKQPWEAGRGEILKLFLRQSRLDWYRPWRDLKQLLARQRQDKASGRHTGSRQESFGGVSVEREAAEKTEYKAQTRILACVEEKGGMLRKICKGENKQSLT